MEMLKRQASKWRDQVAKQQQGQHCLRIVTNMEQRTKLIMDPLRTTVTDGTLENARNLAQQYNRVRHEAETLVEAEKLFHLRLAAIHDDVEAEMITEKQRKVSALPSAPFHKRSEKALYFLAEAIYQFSATSEKELSLEVGDYVVVRQVSPSGWSEGECRGTAGSIYNPSPSDELLSLDLLAGA
ncbi:hypothetical protein C4D60_Mb06t30300 [Musa balbisiana]|uniref:SH3 domain-containing protein n=1 Tax=Musa balbisiana TaxID=52838 RepID=A0A4S8IRR4_MUSBA|nr:hypothetical protein C4D60_Mb06t30300 [Musa balbisiana]